MTRRGSEENETTIESQPKFKGESEQSLRFKHAGWVEVIMADKRRGVWIRVTHDGIEFCGGREGDDLYVAIANNKPPTPSQLKELGEMFETYAWAVESSGI